MSTSPAQPSAPSPPVCSSSPASRRVHPLRVDPQGQPAIVAARRAAGGRAAAVRTFRRAPRGRPRPPGADRRLRGGHAGPSGKRRTGDARDRLAPAGIAREPRWHRPDLEHATLRQDRMSRWQRQPRAACRSNRRVTHAQQSAPPAPPARASGAALPAPEPPAQRADFAKAGEPVVDGVVVAPYDIAQGATGDACLDLEAILCQTPRMTKAMTVPRERARGDSSVARANFSRARVPPPPPKRRRAGGPAVPACDP